MVTDPLADFLIQMKNAGAVGKSVVSIPFSNLKHAVATKLKEVGYIGGVEKRGKKTHKFIDITLAYENGSHKIKGVRRISKPGRRLYRAVREIVPVRYGHGMLVLSTPKGIKTDSEARKERVGGEALFEIW